MKCWKCGSLLDDKDRKLSFRAVCAHCHVSLHCCKNCKNYAPGSPNDCSVPGTEYIRDREANNFCEEFELLGQYSSPPHHDIKQSFDDLFK